MAGETFEEVPFSGIIILEDNTTIDTLEAQDQNGDIVDCLAIMGIDNVTPLPASDSPIKTPIQFPFTKIIVSAGSAQALCDDFLSIPE